MNFRVGNGFDFHPLKPGRRLILGGVEIPHDSGLDGHSDADVAAHAIANAVLGALGLGDLGSHFPDTDARYRDANSIEILTAVWGLATAARWRLGNADLTIFAQRPRLSPHIATMRARLASALGATPADVNVKAASPEGLGALGRGDGMAAAAIVMIVHD